MNQLFLKNYLKNYFNFSSTKDWLLWPPNTFIVTSKILKKTGAYRLVLSDYWDEKDNGENGNWQKIIEEDSQIWRQLISIRLKSHFKIEDKNEEDIRFNKLINKIELVEKILDEQNITFNQLRTLDISLSGIKNDSINHLLEAIITIHSIADEACTGLGLVGIISGRTSIFNCFANLLLTSTGSLSTFPKQIGIALPKMRTPQTGLSIRSFSHHVTHHETEVEIMWRMFPWANIQENTLNILCVCWPNEINNSFFLSTPETFKPIRYFKYSTNDLKEKYKFDPIEIIKLIEGYRQQKGIDRIHMLVLPEIALTENEWKDLLQKLAIYYREPSENKKQLPIIISGVRRENVINKKSVLTNELRIASFFADKWYTISQRKHHRWQLDSRQIRQYELSGRFSTSRKWFEKTELSQRRLSIVTPNGWLSLCPLICEDLAQLEPVSSVIRGIGPTILIALLADGPQLKERWSARYASVFADDFDRDWNDIREVSTALSIVDALIELADEKYLSIIDHLLYFDNNKLSYDNDSDDILKFYSNLITKINISSVAPADVGVLTKQASDDGKELIDKWPTISYQTELPDKAPININEIKKELLSKNKSKKFNNSDFTQEMAKRMNQACILQVLILLHNKLESNRKRKQSGSQLHSNISKNKSKNKSRYSRKSNAILFDKIEKTLIRYGY